ncbi:hypothetical protein [Amycolatopsis sp. NPDC051102]
MPRQRGRRATGTHPFADAPSGPAGLSSVTSAPDLGGATPK